MPEDKQTEVKLRFRIKMLLAERDMTVSQLFEKVRQLGVEVSSSHFYRQMRPYADPMRMDLLTAVVRVLNIPPSELFDLVEVSVSDDASEPQIISKNTVQPKPVEEKVESEKVKRARKTAKQKRDLAMLGTKISVLPDKED